MTNDTQVEELLNSDPFEGLEVAWTNPTFTLAERARLVASLHMRSRMTLEGTARISGATPAQIQALLELATLDDDDLDLVSSANPPATTWLLFAQAEPGEIRAGVEAIQHLSDDDASDTPAVLAVYRAMRLIAGPTKNDRLASLSGLTFSHLEHKAKEYGVLTKYGHGLLTTLSRYKKMGKQPTEKQLDFLAGILIQLIQEGVITHESKDGDQEMCEQILDIFGM